MQKAGPWRGFRTSSWYGHLDSETLIALKSMNCLRNPNESPPSESRHTGDRTTPRRCGAEANRFGKRFCTSKNLTWSMVHQCFKMVRRKMQQSKLHRRHPAISMLRDAAWSADSPTICCTDMLGAPLTSWSSCSRWQPYQSRRKQGYARGKAQSNLGCVASGHLFRGLVVQKHKTR